MSEPHTDPFLTDLTDAEGCYARVAWRIGSSLRSVDHPLRLMSLATFGPDRYPHARLVVMRGFDPDDRCVWFHTDCRSPKVRHISSESRVSLLLYDPGSKVQIRIPASARVHHGDHVAREGWEATNSHDRLRYAFDHGPGTGMDPSTPIGMNYIVADDERQGFDNFVVVMCHFDVMDIVEMHPDGHRRVRLNWDADGLQITRLVP